MKKKLKVGYSLEQSEEAKSKRRFERNLKSLAVTGQKCPVPGSGMTFHFLGYTGLILLLACFTAVAAESACEPPARREREQPVDELIAETYAHKEKISYKCRPGYVKAWSIRLECNDGVWIHLTPAKNCTGKSCGNPRESDYATFELVHGDGFTFGARVEYTCIEGYKMLSQFNYRDCRANGWTNEIPHCEINKCPPLALPENMRIIQGAKFQMNEDFLYGDLVIFGCTGKLKIKGSNKITCTADGTWSAPVPECIEITCQAHRIENGDLLSPKLIYKEGERIRFSCNDGYKYIDRSDALCTETGWSSRLQCAEIKCFPPEVTNGHFLPRRAQYMYNERIDITCNEGSERLRMSSICNADGWEPSPACIQIKCSRPEVTNGHFLPRRNQYIYNEKIDITCNEGFVSQNLGKPSICTAAGWDPRPACKPKECDYINLENGRISWNQYSKREGQSIHFYCFPGFLPANKETWQTATCRNSRYVPEVKCFKTCDPSVGFYHGRTVYYSWNNFIEGDNITFTCDRGYFPANQQSTITCTKNGWSPAPRCIQPEVQQRTCKKVNILHGNFLSRPQSFQIGTKAKYNCHDGYTTPKGDPEAEIQCLTEGWSPEPECIKTCLKPSERDFTYTTTKPIFFPGDELHYECKEGFEITKNAIDETIVCTEKGWEPAPSCVSIECETPILENGTIESKEDTFYNKMVVHFICNKGFIRVGSEYAQCYHFGWFPQPPICKENVKRCLELPIIPHGIITGKRKAVFEHGDLSDVQCDISFALYGSKIIECVDGEWTPLPTCIEESKRCGQPPRIDNEVVDNFQSFIYRHGDTVEYKCNQQYSIIGTNPAKCLHGQWEVPSCLRTCPPPPQLPNAINVADMRIYRSGEEISLKCQEHFLLRGPQKIKCENGIWQTPPRCLDLRCKSPPEIVNGIIEIGNRTMFFPNETVEYNCLSGFEISQPNTVRCENLKWSKLPVCKEKSCGPVPEIANAITLGQDDTEWYDSGKIINYICNDGFNSEDPTKKTCIKGEWVGSFTCKDATCPTPPIIENARISEDTMKKYTNGEQITYQCNDGFEISGSATVTCRQNNWLPLPRCQDVRCSSPPEIQNGQILGDIKETYFPQEKVYYQCNTRYTFLGPSFITCLKKRWEQQLPRCTDIGGGCGRPPPVENGDIMESPKATYLQSETVTYQCQNFYTIQGSRRVTCRNGRWSQTPTCRAACTASEEDMSERNITLRWNRGEEKIYSQDGDRVQFICRRGYKPNPNKAFLVYCVDGKFDYPNCTPI